MSYLLSILYTIVLLIIFNSEYNKFKNKNLDFFSIISIIFAINVIVPPIIVYLCFGSYKQGNILILNVFNNAQWSDHLLLFVLTTISWFMIKIGYYTANKKYYKNPNSLIYLKSKFPKLIGVFSIIILFLAIFGFIGNFGGFNIEIIFSSNLYRAGLIEGESAAAASIYFQLLNIFLFATTFYSFNFIKNKNLAKLWLMLEFITVFFIMLIFGARRIIIIWLLVKILLSLFKNNKIDLKLLFLSIFLCYFVISFGETLMYLLGTGNVISSQSIENNNSLSDSLFNVSSEIGVSFIESLGMIALYKGGYRYGLDSIVFVLSLVPERMIGLEIEWPERFVRYTTQLLSTDKDAADVPPGFIGYMWVNLGSFGVILQSFIYGAFGGLIASILNPLRRYVLGIYLYVLYAFLYAFLVNSGNWEFWFKDYLLTFFLVLVLIFWLRQRIKER